MARFLRGAKVNQIGEGTSEVHKSFIGRRVSRLAGETSQHPSLDLNPNLYCHE